MGIKLTKPSNDLLSPIYFEEITSDRFDRAVHRLYSDPRRIFSNDLADQLFARAYWALRTLQFKIFYRNEIDLDVDEVLEKWEVGVKPPALEEIAHKTGFNVKWIKYMYARFKNECPSGRMKEQEFRSLMSSIIAPERATDQYIARLFLAFSSEDKKTITFQNLIECLALLHPETAESNAQWTVRLVTGTTGGGFAFPDFLNFTQSVFSLNEGKNGYQECNRETILQRAQTVFQELDRDRDGYVTTEDMIHFFKSYDCPTPPTSTTTSTYVTPSR